MLAIGALFPVQLVEKMSPATSKLRRACCWRWKASNAGHDKGSGSSADKADPSERPASVDLEPDRFRNLYQIAHSELAVEKWDNSTRWQDQTAQNGRHRTSAEVARPRRFPPHCGFIYIWTFYARGPQ